MLQDVMEKVNEAEAQAQEIVSSAQRQATDIIEKARLQAKEKSDQAIAQAQEGAKAVLEQAKKQSEAERADYIAKVDDELKQFKQQVLQKEDIAVKALVEKLL